MIWLIIYLSVTLPTIVAGIVLGIINVYRAQYGLPPKYACLGLNLFLYAVIWPPIAVGTIICFIWKKLSVRRVFRRIALSKEERVQIALGTTKRKESDGWGLWI